MTDLASLIDEKLRALSARRAAGILRAWIRDNMIVAGGRSDRFVDDLDAIRGVIDTDIAHIDDRLAEATVGTEAVRYVHEVRETLDAMPCDGCGGPESVCNCECGYHYCGCPCHTDEIRRAVAALALGGES